MGRLRSEVGNCWCCGKHIDYCICRVETYEELIKKVNEDRDFKRKDGQR